MFLQVKPPGALAWEVVSVPDLPPPSTGGVPSHLAVSPTPAPGRQSKTLTKRTASSPPEVPRVAKASKSIEPGSHEHVGCEPIALSEKENDKMIDAAADLQKQTNSFL